MSKIGQIALSTKNVFHRHSTFFPQEHFGVHLRGRVLRGIFPGTELSSYLVYCSSQDFGRKLNHKMKGITQHHRNASFSTLVISLSVSNTYRR